MGGVGKTELAIRYARQHEPDYPGGILWLNARESDPAAEVVQFTQLYMKLEVPQQDLLGRRLSLKERVESCWQNWQPPDGLVLLVLDDVTDLGSCLEALPTDNRFRVLMTTRLRNLDANIEDIPLDVLSPDEAIALLTELIGERRVQKELQAAKELCKWLGYLPLGLELVGRYLSKKPPHWSVAKTLQQLKAQRLEDKALNPQLQQTLSTAQRGVLAAFELSWKELSPTTQKVGQLLSLFAPDIFLWEWVESIAQKLGWIESEVVSANEQLYQHHLIQYVEEIDGGYRIHPLIREFLQAKQVALAAADSLSQGEQSLKQVQSEESRSIKQVYAAFFGEIAKKVPDSPTLVDIELVKLAIPHLEEVAQNLVDTVKDEDLTWIFVSLVNFYRGQGLYVLAEGWCEQCLSAMQVCLGENHPSVANSLNNLAELYRNTGRYNEAELLLIQALEMNKQLLGENHPDVATSLNNLASLYRNTGRYNEAEPLFIQALGKWKWLLGENHPDVATSLNNLALLYRDTGRYHEAEPLLIQALEMRKQLLRENHPSVATSLSSLASLYYVTRRCDEAEPLLVQALGIYEQSLDKDHPYTVTVSQNLERLRAIRASDNQKKHDDG